MQNNPLLKEYLDIAFRRRWWIILPALLGILFATLLYLRFPKLYKATTRAHIKPQTISKALLSPIVEFQATELVNSINAELTSEKNVLDLDSRLKLIGTPRGPRDQADLARRLDGAIELNANPRNRYFDLTVTWEDPRLAANIANELAEIYIQRTESTRQDLASGTLEKLTKIREDAESRLGEIQRQIDQFQGQHKFEVDAYRDTNLQRLATVRAEIDRIDTRVRGFEDDIRRFQLELQSGPTVPGPGGTVVVDPRTIELARLKQELSEQVGLGRTDMHPEVRTRKDRIALLEQQLAGGGPSDEAPATDPARARVELEIGRLRREIAADNDKRAQLVAEAGMIQAQLERTPDRETALQSMLQIRDRLETEYRDAQQKERDAREGEMVEDFKQGERFEILNPARAPKDPFWPDLRFFLLMGLAVGGGLGIALVLLLEVFDQSFKSEEQLAAAIDLPILAVIPDLNRVESKSRRRGTRAAKGAA
ncbi:MAG: hypothetical protein MUC67_05105 [Acidobacteria bacterium]|jgi:uncharacterized protein involved in exopolysaccharide biosynthesis|nr:hypothetical protein [Acidobacteriota bacterium]MCU0254276.1 hypothetical protein [Acidobacteriota bacterium]